MKIKNWAKFQHYKHRNPPWIKLHKSLLNDPEWFSLDPAASKMLANLWLIASEDHGKLPAIKTLAFRLRMSCDELSSIISGLSHWIDLDASALLAPRLQHATTETETETETEKNTEKGKYYFEDGVIRLTKEDFEKWRDALPNIDLKAELLALSSWASTQPNWFHAVKGALAKRNRENRPREASPKTTEDILNPTNKRAAWGLP